MTNLLDIGLANAAGAAVLALVVLGVTRFWRNPHLAHVLWLLVLVKLATPPLVRLHVSIAYPSAAVGVEPVDTDVMETGLVETVSVEAVSLHEYAEVTVSPSVVASNGEGTFAVERPAVGELEAQGDDAGRPVEAAGMGVIEAHGHQRPMVGASHPALYQKGQGERLKHFAHGREGALGPYDHSRVILADVAAGDEG